MNLKKSISLSLILIAILLICVSSISACDVDDAGTNVTLLGNHNDLCDYRDIGDLNYDDYSTENSTAEIDDTTSSEESIIHHNDHIDDLVVIENSNSDNDITKVDEIINMTDIIDSSAYTINQTSDNTFILTLEDNSTITLGVLQVYDLKSFKQVANSVSTDKCQFDAIVIDFKNNLKLEFEPWSDELIKLGHMNNLIIRGNGATIAVRNPSKNDERHFLKVETKDTIWMSNITIIGFNTAILNYGTCQINNVLFKNNKVDYMIEEDYAGAVRNWGILKCSDCSFLGNYAKYGGAIYNDKGSQSTFVDCLFKDNTAYNKNKCLLETNDGNNIYTSPGATCLVLNHNDDIKCINIETESDYHNFLNMMNTIGHVKFLILNFTSAKVYNINQQAIYMPGVENIYIYGNGARISVKDYADSNEYNFLKTVQGQFCSIDNLTICRFNTAILNKGSLAISHSHFINNRVDYKILDDNGGAIYNDEGLITLSDTTFEGSYGKDGGAIYNNRGIISMINCDFRSNTAYGDGGVIYNNVGLIYGDNCSFTNSAAENGGAIFNHYGIIMMDNVTFDKSVAEDDGGAIYNDFGQITISNCTFRDSKADDGKNLFNYGEDATYSISGEGYNIKTGDITSDAPNEVLRWVIRGVEIALCIALVLVCAHFCSEAVAGAICFWGGGLLAGAEELIEGIYLDHNFNVYNCLLMMAIAGAIDAITGVATTFIGHVCFKVVNGAVTVGSEAVFNAIGIGIDIAGEVVTEVLPRADFSNTKVPTTILDLQNPQIPC